MPSLDVEVEDGIALLTINNTEKRNAVGAWFWRRLDEVLRSLADGDEARAIVLTGAGDRAFCAGGDISAFAELDTLPKIRRHVRKSMAAFAAIETCPLPVVAAVGGYALGAGFELTLACDVAIASERAVFGTPEVRLGLMPAFGVIRGADVIGPSWMRYLAYSGERIDAATALRLGLVQEVVPHAELSERARALAGQVRDAAPMSVGAVKAVVNAQLDQRALAQVVEAATVLHSSADRNEGLAAFTERRPPRFANR